MQKQTSKGQRRKGTFRRMSARDRKSLTTGAQNSMNDSVDLYQSFPVAHVWGHRRLGKGLIVEAGSQCLEHLFSQWLAGLYVRFELSLPLTRQLPPR